MLEDTRALVPGSFDPVTRGHLDIVRRASRIFRHVYVAVIVNPGKRSLFSLEERTRLLEAELADLVKAGRVELTACDSLTVQAAAKVGARWIVRGLRSGGDADYELPMALSNRRCGPEEVETLFLAATPEMAFISSRLVREIAAYGGKLEAFVTPKVEKALREKAKEERRG